MVRKKVENYRPLTLTSNIAKLYEKMYYIRLNKFITNNNIVVNEQYGFQKGKSTIKAIADATEIITKALNDKKHVLGLFIDMSKAFDCVDHKKLVNILDHYGIRGIALDWIKSYLSDRPQCVELNGKNGDTIDKIRSEFLVTEFGVPQGTILPFIPKPTITAENNVIENVEFTKFLGVTVDHRLRWADHIVDDLLNKLRKSVFVLRQLSQIVDTKSLLKVYYELVYSPATYGNLVWGGASSTILNRVFTIQNSAVRILSNLPPLHSCRGYFIKNNILTLHGIYVFLCITHITKNPFRIQSNNVIHEHFTRGSNNIHTEFYRCNVGKNNPLHTGSVFFNKLPIELKANQVPA